MKTLSLLLLIFLISCGESKFNQVRKVTTIESDGSGIATKTIVISDTAPSNRCTQSLSRDDIPENIELFYCSENSFVEVSYQVREDMGVHIKADNRSEEIIINDDGTTLSVIGDYPYFTTSAYQIDSKIYLRVYLQHEKTSLSLSIQSQSLTPFVLE